MKKDPYNLGISLQNTDNNQQNEQFQTLIENDQNNLEINNRNLQNLNQNIPVIENVVNVPDGDNAHLDFSSIFWIFLISAIIFFLVWYKKYDMLILLFLTILLRL